MSEIVWLHEEQARDAASVGGKAANLARFAAAHPVPEGFALSVSAFDRWWQRPLGAGPETPMELPEDFVKAVAAAYGKLAEISGTSTPAVAVRSSALDEDGATASFAGQHETFLNSVGPDQIATNIARCWASVENSRALAYRRAQKTAGAGPAKMGVIVQRLVPADAAAVVFTANPVTGDPGEIVINANWGLGESIVGGTVTPDTYVVRKSDLTVVESAVAEKSRMTVRGDQGTEEVDVPSFLRNRPALTEAQIRRVAEMAMQLENDLGQPVDVEAAFAGDDLYLLQCRPVTALGGAF